MLGDWGVAIWLAVWLRGEGRARKWERWAGRVAEAGGEARRLEVHTASPVRVAKNERTEQGCLRAKGSHKKSKPARVPTLERGETWGIGWRLFFKPV